MSFVEMPAKDSQHLPPPDAWKVDPRKLRKFYAPVDDRNFVVPDATVEAISELFEDDYEWPIDFSVQQLRPDLHHFHWMARLYSPERYNGRSLPGTFRELPSMKGVLPRQFHNVIHAVTLPPQQPKFADMERHLKAFLLARRLFESAQNASDTQLLISRLIADSSDSLANEILITRFGRQFRGYKENVELVLAESVLTELRLDDSKIAKRKPNEVKQQLARVGVFQVANYVPQFQKAA